MNETDSLSNNRPQFEKEVEALLSQRLKERGFTLSNIQSSVKPNEAMQSAINSKNISVQQSLKTQNELMQAKAEAEKKIVAARGEAEANKILQMSVTPQLIQLRAIEKWDGKLPQVTSENVPFISINK